MLVLIVNGLKLMETGEKMLQLKTQIQEVKGFAEDSSCDVD